MTRARARAAAPVLEGGPSTDVVFGLPDPPGRTPRYDWEAIAAKLRRRPGEWARIYEQDKTSIATAVRANAITAVRSNKGFEVRTSNNRRTSPRVCDLHMRYVPERDQEKAST